MHVVLSLRLAACKIRLCFIIILLSTYSPTNHEPCRRQTRHDQDLQVVVVVAVDSAAAEVLAASEVVVVVVVVVA